MHSLTFSQTSDLDSSKSTLSIQQSFLQFDALIDISITEVGVFNQLKILDANIVYGVDAISQKLSNEKRNG